MFTPTECSADRNSTGAGGSPRTPSGPGSPTSSTSSSGVSGQGAAAAASRGLPVVPMTGLTKAEWLKAASMLYPVSVAPTIQSWEDVELLLQVGACRRDAIISLNTRQQSSAVYCTPAPSASLVTHLIIPAHV